MGVRVAGLWDEPRPYDAGGAGDGFETKETFVTHSSGSEARTPRSATPSARLNAGLRIRIRRIFGQMDLVFFSRDPNTVPDLPY